MLIIQQRLLLWKSDSDSSSGGSNSNKALNVRTYVCMYNVYNTQCDNVPFIHSNYPAATAAADMKSG